MLVKPFHEITADDIRDLCARGAYENQLLEYKRELPAERKRADPWLEGGDFTAYARDRLLREIVAFANAQGGTLVLGIDETDEEPARAANIHPLPRVHDLAKRLEDAARACIDPVLPGLQVRGIETAGCEEGVVVFRAIESPVAPHRVRNEGHAYIRRGASSVPMTMREIQDLTLDRARGEDRLNQIFRDRATLFSEWWQTTGSGPNSVYRITALPVGGFPGIPRLSGEPNEFPIGNRFPFSYGQTRDCLIGPRFNSFRQILRGQRNYIRDDPSTYGRIDVLESGIVDLWHWMAPRESAPRESTNLSIGWLLGSYLAVLDAIDRARSMAGVPEWEFVIEFFLDGTTGTPGAGGGKIRLGELTMKAFFDPFSPRKIDELPVKFPRISYRSQGDREAVLHLVLQDIIDASGGPRGEVPFKLERG